MTREQFHDIDHDLWFALQKRPPSIVHFVPTFRKPEGAVFNQVLNTLEAILDFIFPDQAILTTSIKIEKIKVTEMSMQYGGTAVLLIVGFGAELDKESNKIPGLEDRRAA